MVVTDVEPALQGRRVLVVEDEMLIAMELEALLRGLGCTVVGPVPDARRALALLEKERPDAALLDLNLNGKPVTPVASALSDRDVPFLLLTGYSSALQDEKTLQNAPRMSKPVNARKLGQALAELIA